MEKPCRVFCCYARKDQTYLFDLKTHLKSLEREGLVSVKADIDISPGTEWEGKINHNLEAADIILLLISPDFIASDYCYHKEMWRAIQRHEQGTARVVPVIVRPASWHSLPFGKLQALPKDAAPISTSPDRDIALLSVTKGIRKVVKELTTTGSANPEQDDPWLRPPRTAASSQAKHDTDTSQNPSKFNIQNEGPIQNQVIGDNNINNYGPVINGPVSGGQFIGGQNNQVIGEQHITHIGEQKDGLRSLEKGSQALWNADYNTAKKELRTAKDEIDGQDRPREAAKAHYLLALALLNGQLPRTQGGAIMQSIEQSMDNATRLFPCASYYRIFACIKKNFFEHNGLSHRLNEVEALKRYGSSLPRNTDDEENEQYFRRCQPLLQI